MQTTIEIVTLFAIVLAFAGIGESFTGITGLVITRRANWFDRNQRMLLEYVWKHIGGFGLIKAVASALLLALAMFLKNTIQ